MWMRTIPILIFTGALWAQGLPPCRLTPLDTYLGIECASQQMQTIRQNNATHLRWRTAKEQRIYQVRGELVEETNRSPLDPLALGLRHAEVEAICREIDEREEQLVKVNRDALNDAQKLKLAALEEAMRLVPIANLAVQEKLIAAAPAVFGILTPNPVPWSGIPVARAATIARTGACATTRIPGIIIPVITPGPLTPEPNTTVP